MNTQEVVEVILRKAQANRRRRRPQSQNQNLNKTVLHIAEANRHILPSLSSLRYNPPLPSA